MTDLGLFSTKSLVEANADHAVEVRTQVNINVITGKELKGQPDHCKAVYMYCIVLMFPYFLTGKLKRLIKNEALNI